MGILGCKTPKGATGKKGTGVMAAVGGSWASRCLSSTPRHSLSGHPAQETMGSGDKILMTHREVWQDGETRDCQLSMGKTQHI